MLEPGIYFGLPAEIYHSDPALSRSDIVNLLDTPFSYWSHSFMNPNRERNEASEAMQYGEAFHYLLFEPQLFEKLYNVIGADAWEEGKKKIKRDDYFAMVEMIKVLRAGRDSSLFLSGGYPEVTIVFDHQGRRYRTRHDYLTPVLTTDFKSSYTLHEGHIKKEFDHRGYDVQMRLYKLSRERWKQQFKAGEAHVFGDVDRAFIAKFLAQEMNEFIFIFQRTKAPYPYVALMPEQDTENSGDDKIFKAVKIHDKYLISHGTKPWPVCEGNVRPFSMFFGMRESN